MPSVLEQQLAWVRAVMSYLGVSANELARRAGVSPSTVQRPLSDPSWPHAMSAKTISAIATIAGVQPLEFPGRVGGVSEPEAVPFQYAANEDAIGSNVDRAVRELCRGRNGREPWVIRSHALELSGLLPGDIVIVDMNLQPQPKDIVCAQLYEWSQTKAETVFRLYEPPYLLTNSMRLGIQKPIPVDGQSVIIRGVVDGLFRRRN